MKWSENEQIFIEFRLENWVSGWSWEYSQAHDYITELIVIDHSKLGLSVDESVQRFIQLGIHIRSIANERKTA